MTEHSPLPPVIGAVPDSAAQERLYPAWKAGYARRALIGIVMGPLLQPVFSTVFMAVLSSIAPAQTIQSMWRMGSPVPFVILNSAVYLYGLTLYIWGCQGVAMRKGYSGMLGLLGLASPMVVFWVVRLLIQFGQSNPMMTFTLYKLLGLVPYAFVPVFLALLPAKKIMPPPKPGAFRLPVLRVSILPGNLKTSE